MDKQTILDFISQHYEWRYPRPSQPPSTDAEKRRLLRYLNELKSREGWEDNADTLELIAEIQGMLEPKENRTMPIELIKKKQPEHPCEDCGKMVTNRCVHSKLLQSPKPHWRHTCNVCRMTKNPDTGKFSINFSNAQSFFVDYFRYKD